MEDSHIDRQLDMVGKMDGSRHMSVMASSPRNLQQYLLDLIRF